MPKNPSPEKLSDVRDIEVSPTAFTRGKDVVVGVVSAGGLAVLGEARHARTTLRPASGGTAASEGTSRSASI